MFNQIMGGQSADNLSTTPSQDVVLANGGNDIITADFQSIDYIIGGNGDDLLITTFSYKDFKITPHAGITDGYIVRYNGTGEKANIVKGIETFQFAEGTISLQDFIDGKQPDNGQETFTLSADSDSVDEGNAATFILTTTNVPAGTELAYTISGVSPSDITGALTGKAVVGADGKAVIKVAVAADAMTEAVQDTLTVTLDDHKEATASILVNDTSMDQSSVTHTLDGQGQIDAPVMIDAGIDDFLYIDDLTLSNFVEIEHFGEGDQIKIIADADDLVEIKNYGENVVITNNSSTVEGDIIISSITLLGVVSAADLVYDAGTLNNAMGFEVLTITTAV